MSENGIGLLTVFCWLLSDGHAATFVGSMYADGAGSGRNAQGEFQRVLHQRGEKGELGVCDGVLLCFGRSLSSVSAMEPAYVFPTAVKRALFTID